MYYLNMQSRLGGILKYKAASLTMRTNIWSLFNSSVYQLSYSGFESQSLVNHCGVCVCVCSC